MQSFEETGWGRAEYQESFLEKVTLEMDLNSQMKSYPNGKDMEEHLPLGPDGAKKGVWNTRLAG